MRLVYCMLSTCAMGNKYFVLDYQPTSIKLILFVQFNLYHMCQSWGFTSCSKARVISSLSLVGLEPYRGDSLLLLDAKLANH